jgi:hypothetical protein
MASPQSLYETMIESRFKKVPEGWLFTTMSPWGYGPRRTYLVSDAQKPAIAARARRGAYIQHVMLVLMVLVFGGFALVPSLSNFSLVATWLIWGGSCVVWTIVIGVADYLGLQPLLRDIPRSSQKIKWTYILQRMGAAVSVRALVIFFTLISVAEVAFVGLSMGGTPSSFVAFGMFATLVAVNGALFAIIYAGMRMAKLRAR